jgi:cytochrome b subunit of formate dehydrogenase
MNTKILANVIALATSWGAFIVTILEQANEMLGALSAMSGALLTIVFAYTNFRMKMIEIREKKAKAKRAEIENYWYEKEQQSKYEHERRPNKNE